MASPYARGNLRSVEDSAARFGFGETQEARFASDDLGTEQTGVSHHRIKPGRRQAFGHRHEGAEEIYVVLSGSGRLALDGEVIEVGPMDAIRVSPRVVRAFEAGEEGLEVLAVGPRRPDDRGEVLSGWWPD